MSLHFVQGGKAVEFGILLSFILVSGRSIDLLRAAPAARFQRHRRLSLAQEQMNTIRVFCARGQDDDWTRYLACGVCWLWSTRVTQFAFAIGRRKSSVKRVMAKLNFVAHPAQGSDANELRKRIPCLRRHLGELKHWEIREQMVGVGRRS
jgi:hypothetical protein